MLCRPCLMPACLRTTPVNIYAMTPLFGWLLCLLCPCCDWPTVSTFCTLATSFTAPTIRGSAFGRVDNALITLSRASHTLARSIAASHAARADVPTLLPGVTRTRNRFVIYGLTTAQGRLLRRVARGYAPCALGFRQTHARPAPAAHYHTVPILPTTCRIWTFGRCDYSSIVLYCRNAWACVCARQCPRPLPHPYHPHHPARLCTLP